MKKEEQRENFRSLLGFKEHGLKKVIEKTTLESPRDTFEGENIQTHYKVLIFILMTINLQWRLMKKITKIGILVVK